MTASLTVLVDGGVDGGLGSYRGVWIAHRRAVPRRNLSLIEKINALPGPTLPSSLLKFRVPQCGRPARFLVSSWTTQSHKQPRLRLAQPRSIAQAVESLLENAAEALTRATDCDDADWQKFHLGTAAACKELALQLEPLVSIQARIDEKTALIRRRFQLGPQPTREASVDKPDAREPEDVVTAPETIAASSDLSPPPGSGHGYDVDDVEAFKAHVDAMFAIKPSTAPASTE